MLNGRLDAARGVLERPIEGSTEAVDLNVERGRRLIHLAEWMRHSGRYDEALAYTQRAATAFAALYPPEHPRLGGVARTHGLILRDRHRYAEAETELRRAHAILAKGIGKDANTTLDTEIQLAELLLARDRADEARALSQRIGPLLPERFVEQAPLRQYVDLLRRLE